MKSFHDKVAAITGAGSGIGRALALNLARQGCELALSDINEQGLAETVEQARRFEVKVSHQRVDVADFEAVRHWADQVMIDHGRVNLIINNAGVAQAEAWKAMRWTTITGSWISTSGGSSTAPRRFYPT